MNLQNQKKICFLLVVYSDKSAKCDGLCRYNCYLLLVLVDHFYVLQSPGLYEKQNINAIVKIKGSNSTYS